MQGYVEINNDTWKAFRKLKTVTFAGSKEAEGKRVDITSTVGGDRSDHGANFIDAIRSGKDETLNYDIIEGHYSSALLHLSNISYRLGRELKFTGDYEKFANDPENHIMLTQKYRRHYVVPLEL